MVSLPFAECKSEDGGASGSWEGDGEREAGGTSGMTSDVRRKWARMGWRVRRSLCWRKHNQIGDTLGLAMHARLNPSVGGPPPCGLQSSCLS